MKWSLKLGRIAGVEMFVHWTFLILLAWLFVAYLGVTRDVAAAAGGVAFTLALFGCVVLHEFGHAFAARRYGIKTRDITLLPIGGVARLERMPENPRHELWVAIAGPLVNIAIAAVLYPFAQLGGSTPVNAELAHTLASGGFVERLLRVNLFLAAFNLLPAFPMDGGRVLRALLATRLGRRRATQIAANVGQAMAIGLGLLGLLFNPLLVFVALFVYLGAGAEAQMVELTTFLRGLTVRDAMQTRYRTLEPHAPLSVAIGEVLSGSQQDFPVVSDGVVVGMLRRRDLVKALAERGPSTPIESAMSRACNAVNGDVPLERALELLQDKECSSLPVLVEGRLSGLLTMENLSELMTINTALERNEKTTAARTPVANVS